MAASDVGGLTFNSSGALLVPRPSTPPSQTAYGQNRTALRYRSRHRIENLFSRVKDYTRITLRKDKTSHSYAGFVSLAFALINIQLCT
jgi:transposase